MSKLKILAILSLPLLGLVSLAFLRVNILDSDTVLGILRPSSEESTYLLTDFSGNRPETFKDEFYGSHIEDSSGGTDNYCMLRGSSYDRCGVATDVREVDYGIGAGSFHGIRVNAVNLGTSASNYQGYIRASWFDSDWSYALNGKRGVVQSPEIDFGELQPNEITAIDIPWSELNIPGFDHNKDYLGGVSVRNLASQALGIVKIELYGDSNSAPAHIATPHSGGYMKYIRASDGAEFTYDTFTGTGWGAPFEGQTLRPGDIIEVYGVINAGTIIGEYHGTAGNPVIIRGMTPDAAFDLKGATRQGQNGGIITLYGNYYLIENLELRNCGNGYGGHDNASAFHTTTQNTTFRNLKVYNCGHGFLIPGKNNLIEDSDVYNNGYFESGYSHNFYISGSGNILRNNRIHHSGGQNLKLRGWDLLIENNLIYNAGNFDVDFAGYDQNPGNTSSIFRGNTVKKSSFGANQSMLFTLHEDAGAPNAGNKVDKVYAINNTFIGPDNNNTNLFRVGKNKTIEAYNNVFWGVKKIKYAGTSDNDIGTLTGSNNWILQDATLTGDLSDSIPGTDPELSVYNQFYFPKNDSPLINSGNNEVLNIPGEEYGWPYTLKKRYSDSSVDIGASEFTSACIETWDCSDWSCSSENFSRSCTDINNCGTVYNKPSETGEACEAEIPEEPCEENWTCEEWGVCQDGLQTRACTDANSCNTEENKPEISQVCVPEPETEIIVFGKDFSPDGYNSVTQSRMNKKYYYYGYDTVRHTLNVNNRLNLKFDDLENYVPEGKVLEKAEITLNFYKHYDDQSYIGFYQILEDWEGEGHSSWKFRQGASTHKDVPSDLEQIDWEEYGSTVEIRPYHVYKVSNPDNEDLMERTFDITELMEKVLDGPNYGIQLRADHGSALPNISGINHWNRDRSEYYGPKLALTFGPEPEEEVCEPEEPEESCEENWVCGDWGECDGSTRQRTCSDTNQCGTEDNKPAIEEACEAACDAEIVTLGKNYSPENYNNVIQSGLNANYPYEFGYDRRDNQINDQWRYNLEFGDLAGFVPEGKTLQKAEIALRFYNQSSDASVGFYKITEDWEGQGHTSWGYIQGVTAITNDGRHDSILPEIEWSTYGGSVEPNSYAVYNVPNGSTNLTFDITGLAQELINGSNYGFQIRAENSTDINDLFGIDYWLNDQYFGPKLILEFGCE